MSRVDVVNKLSDYLKTPSNLSERDKYLEENLLLPTIGPEVEVHWKTLIPDLDFWFGQGGYSSFDSKKKREFDKICNSLEREILPLYEKTRELGIPQGKIQRYSSQGRVGGFWEFSNDPVNWYKTLSSEIGILFDSGLIKEGYNNPLHLTLGSVEKSKDLELIASMVEFLGGSNYERINLANTFGIRRSWNCKGEKGLLERRKIKINGAYKKGKGVEIRTLVAKDKFQVQETLKNSQMLSYALQESRLNNLSFFGEEWFKIKKLMIEEFLKPNDLFLPWKGPEVSSKTWKRFGFAIENREYFGLKEEIQRRIDSIQDLFVELSSVEFNSV